MPYLYVETAKERLCRGSRLLLGGLCNDTLVPSALRATKDESSKTIRVIFPEHSTDAVIYVTVVIVFYAAIILILLGTNIRRFRRNATPTPSDNRLHLVVHIDNKEKVVQTSTTENKMANLPELKNVATV